MRSCVQTPDWYYETISYTAIDSSACSHRQKKHLSGSVWNNMSWEYRDGVHTVVITSKSLLAIPSLRLTSLLLRPHSKLGNTSNSKSPHDLTAGRDSETVWDWLATENSSGSHSHTSFVWARQKQSSSNPSVISVWSFEQDQFFCFLLAENLMMYPDFTLLSRRLFYWVEYESVCRISGQ